MGKWTRCRTARRKPRPGGSAYLQSVPTLWPGTNGARCAFTPIGPMPAAAAVRNAERFMQVEVRNVGADKARRGDPDLGVHVGAVEINLAAKLMHYLAHFANGLFIHAVGRRIGDHDAGEIGPRLLCFSRRSARSMLPFYHRQRPLPAYPPSARKPGWCRARELGIRQISRWPSLRLS